MAFGCDVYKSISTKAKPTPLASRLARDAASRKNITGLLEELDRKNHHLGQSAFNEQLFDISSGFEALKSKQAKLCGKGVSPSSISLPERPEPQSAELAFYSRHRQKHSEWLHFCRPQTWLTTAIPSYYYAGF